MKDQDGDTLLHYAVANCESDVITDILEKGGDVMMLNHKICFDYKTNSRKKARTSLMPLEVAIRNKKSKFFFKKRKSF